MWYNVNFELKNKIYLTINMTVKGVQKKRCYGGCSIKIFWHIL